MANSRFKKEGWLHPVHGWLIAALLLFVAASQLQPVRARRQALADARARAAMESSSLAEIPTPPLEDETPIPLPFVQLPDRFEPWFLDLEVLPDVCAFDARLDSAPTLDIHKARFKNGLELRLSPQDLAFVAWTAFTYDLNPHFLLGVMMAESAGDCSAVSSAGAQGCFQITYTMGAGQLKNSFPERVASWYWAPRSNGAVPRRTGEALGYWPADLYVPPSQYFQEKLPASFRQLRMTLDPVATLQASRRAGDTAVSSVANFSFGVVGAGLYFHFLNYYLYGHLGSREGEIRQLTGTPGEKVRFMAASYNQGAPRTMRNFGRYGADRVWNQTAPDVLNYAYSVASFCEQLQSGKNFYDGTMTWGQFSDWLEQLRWTYSELPIDWVYLQENIRERFFTHRKELELRTGLLEIFHALRALEPRLGPERPVVDHQVRF